MLYRKIKKINLAVTFLIVCSAGLIFPIYFLAFTATGLTWMLNSNLKDPSANITLSRITNELNGNTTLNDLVYKSNFVDISFKQVTLNWNPLSIFGDQLVIDDLSGNELSVNIKSNAAEPNKFSGLSFPKATNVLNASINGLEIKSNNNHLYSINTISVDNIYLDDSFFADQILLQSSKGQWVNLSGQFGFYPTSIINLTTESSYLLPGNSSRIQAKGTLVGNAAQLRFAQKVSSPFNAEITGRIQHVFTKPHFIMNTKLKSIDLLSASKAKYLKRVTGDIDVIGHWTQLNITSDLVIKDSANKNWETRFVALSHSNALNFKLDIAAEKKRKAQKSHAHFKGTYDLKRIIDPVGKTRGLKVKGEWNGISIPLNKDNTVIASSGNIYFDGSTYLSNVNAEGVKLDTLGPTLTKLAINTQQGSNGELLFNGVATSLEGNLILSGSMLKHKDSFKLENLFLSGKNFPIMRKPQAHIIVSPNLSFVRNNKIMTSTGTITVPTANIQLQEFNNTLAVISSVIDSNNAAFGSSGYVDVKFGKSVWLHGFGLNAHVTGDISLRDMSNRQLVASGELNVLRGNYRNLKEDHLLSGGRLKFKNDGLDNPELELSVKKRRNASVNPDKIMGRLQKLFIETNKAKNVQAHNGKASKLTTMIQPTIKKLPFM